MKKQMAEKNLDFTHDELQEYIREAGEIVRENYSEKLNSKLAHAIEQDGQIFLTATKTSGKTALRTCFINPRTTKKDVEWILEVIRDVAVKLL